MPEGDLLLAALDGRNECVEGTLGSLDEDVEEGGNELEHNVLLTIGKRRTWGLIGAPLTLQKLSHSYYLCNTTDPLCGGTPKLSPGIRARPAPFPIGAPASSREQEIGRASCRERV